MTEFPEKADVTPDRWAQLRKYTAARIALGRTGVSVPSRELLSFKLDHAHARDAVYSILETGALRHQLESLSLNVHVVHSQASSRDVYIQRPDLGRRLDEASSMLLKGVSARGELVIVMADGLSAEAVNKHARPLLDRLVTLLRGAGLVVTQCLVAEQGRVAIGDDIGERLEARLVLVLIGERPGLSSPDSLGAYLTYGPRVGLTDESRNCVSNIRPAGLGYIPAADKLLYLIVESCRVGISGIMLKDNNALK